MVYNVNITIDTFIITISSQQLQIKIKFDLLKVNWSLINMQYTN